MNTHRLLYVASAHIAVLLAMMIVPRFLRADRPPQPPEVDTIAFRTVVPPPPEQEKPDESEPVVTPPPEPEEPEPAATPPKPPDPPPKKPDPPPQRVQKVSRPVPPPPPPSAAEIRRQLLDRAKRNPAPAPDPVVPRQPRPPAPPIVPPPPRTRPVSGAQAIAYQARLEASCLAPVWNQLKPNGLTDRRYEAIVRIEVQPDGTLVWKGFQRRSGETMVDNAIERTIERATCNLPLPPNSQPLQLTLTFELN